jgi:hypothetical protein
MKLPAMPTISEIVKLYGLSARQQLSQNFILDMNLCARIVRSCGDLTGCTVLEVTQTDLVIFFFFFFFSLFVFVLSNIVYS